MRGSSGLLHRSLHTFSTEAIGSKGHIWQMSGLNVLTCFVSTHLVRLDFSLKIMKTNQTTGNRSKFKTDSSQ